MLQEGLVGVMKELKDNKDIAIPDEWIYDYNKPDEDNKKSWESHRKAAADAWRKLDANESSNSN